MPAGFGPWTWLTLGAALLAIEVLISGTFVLWSLGISAILVGLISLVIDLAWQLELILFALLTLVSALAWWRLGGRAKTSVDRLFLNRRTEAFIGRVFTVETPITNGRGTVRIDDTVWRVSGPDCPTGSRVKVARVDGPLLMVEAIETDA
jgi:inner membrane protein